MNNNQEEIKEDYFDNCNIFNMEKEAKKKKAPFYHIVVADSKSPRDGRIIEQIGTYDPMTDPSTIVLDKEKVEKWIKNGAKPTETVKKLIEKGA